MKTLNKKPKTIVINGRCDIRSIATLHRHYFNMAEGNLNMSQLVRRSLDTYAEVLVANKICKPFKSTIDAKRYLDQVRMNIPQRNQRNLIEQIQRETLLEDQFSSSYVDNPRRALRPRTKVEPSLVEKARGIMSSTEKLGDAVERRERELEETKKQLGVIPNEAD